MATRAGLAVNESANLRGRCAAEVLKQLSDAVCSDPSYRAVDSAPDTVQFVRIFRPLWAVIAGATGTVVLMGAGVLLFLIKRTESCVISSHDGSTGTVVTVSGRLTRARAQLVRSILADTAAMPHEAVALDFTPRHPAAVQAVEPAPLVSPQPPGERLIAETLVRSSVEPAPSLSAPSMQPRAVGGEDFLTVVRSLLPTDSSAKVSALSDMRPRLVARFDDGTTVELLHLTLIGRQPVGLPEEAAAALVPLLDPTMTVSKTHLSVRPVVGGAEIIDRSSANGTTVTSDGDEARLVAGHPIIAPPGSRVRFGDRAFDLVDG